MDSNIINWYFGRIGRDNEFVTFFFVDLFLDLHTEDVQGVARKYFCFENSCEIPFLARVGVYDVQNRFWLVEIRDMRVLKHAYLR